MSPIDDMFKLSLYYTSFKSKATIKKDLIPFKSSSPFCDIQTINKKIKFHLRSADHQNPRVNIQIALLPESKPYRSNSFEQL